MIKLNDSTHHLKRDLSKLEKHIKSFQHDLLPTWQADTLTRLIEVVYITQGRKLPGGFTPWNRKEGDRWALTRAYSNAAGKISHNVLWRKLMLPIRYHLALQKYGEVRTLDLRCLASSADHYRSSSSAARMLISRNARLLNGLSRRRRIILTCSLSGVDCFLYVTIGLWRRAHRSFRCHLEGVVNCDGFLSIHSVVLSLV